MNEKQKQKLILGGFGAILAYAIYKNTNGSASSNSSNPPFGPVMPGEGLLDTLSSTVSSAVSAVEKATGSLQTNFVQTMTPIAESVRDHYGIDPLITITQAAHESGWGASGLTKKANNLYGYTFSDAQMTQWLSQLGLAPNTSMDIIRGMDLSTAPFIMMPTYEEITHPIEYFSRPGDIITQSATEAKVYRPFRRYDSWASSVEDWVQLLQKPRYASAWQDALHGDLDKFAQDIYAGGYATDSTYPVQIVRVGGEVSDIQNA